MIKNSNNYRWRILALLFFATTINYIDRQVIGILKPFIAEDLGWGEADYGYIVTAFQIAYATGLLTTGRLLDKFGVRIGYLWAIIVWSIAGMAHAAAWGVASMIGLSGFAGAIGGALSASFIGLLLETSGSYLLIFLIAASVYQVKWLIMNVLIKEIKPITV